MSDKLKLQNKFDVWYRGASRGKVAPSSHNYDQNLKLVTTFDTVESFWSVYTHLIRPHDLTGHCDLNVFKSGIKPLWEDNNNKEGGMWKLRLRKGLVSRFWENLLFAFVGEQFNVGDEICGIVVGCRYYEDYLCIWNRNGRDETAKSKIRDTLKHVLKLGPDVVVEYKIHSEALKKSSTRNTNKPNVGSVSKIISA